MASFDRKFAVVRPTLDRLVREPVEVADTRLLDPQNTIVVPVIDGELMFYNSVSKLVRATPAGLGFFCIDDRGDTGIQASRKLSVITGGGGFQCETVVYDTALTTLGQGVEVGAVNNSLSGSVARSGLVAFGAGVRIGYVTKLAAVNGGLLRILSVLV